MVVNMIKFTKYLEENSFDSFETSQLSKVWELTFGSELRLNSGNAAKLCRRFIKELPKNINEPLVLNPANEYKGSLVITKLGGKMYLVQHLNDCTNLNNRKKDEKKKTPRLSF